jgi:hypothetical protein
MVNDNADTENTSVAVLNTLPDKRHICRTLRAPTSRLKFPLNSPLTHHLSNLDAISPVAHSKYGLKI